MKENNKNAFRIEKNNSINLKEKNRKAFIIEKNNSINLKENNKNAFRIEKNISINLKEKNKEAFKIEKNNFNILKEKNNESFLTQDTSEDEHKTIKLSETPKGLENFSLNCYMNSLLQCFYHIKGLRNNFIEPSEFSKENQKVCYALSEVMNHLTYGKEKNYSPINFKKTLGEKNSIFKGTKGGDVSDLYRTIIDSIIEENPYEYPEDDNDDGDNTNQKNMYLIAKKEVDENNPIIKELNYFYETIYFCPKGSKCYSIQNDTSIILDLLKASKWAKSNNLALNKCFEHYFRLLDNNEFYCSKCDEFHKNKSQDKILSLPKVLTIILNRGKGKQFTNHVKIDEIINIEKYVDETFIEKKNRKYKYKLIGISTHTGSSSYAGHYYSYCYREKENKFYCFNDTTVMPVKKKEYLNDGYSEPYILFYEHIQ